MNPEPVEITWNADGIEVVHAVDAEWVETLASRREYER
jgi:hypothetical protein